MELWEKLRKCASAANGRQWRGFLAQMAGHPLRAFHPPLSPNPIRKGWEMKWYKPIDSLKQEFQEPVQRIAIISIVAIVLAALALIIATAGKAN